MSDDARHPYPQHQQGIRKDVSFDFFEFLRVDRQNLCRVCIDGVISLDAEHCVCWDGVCWRVSGCIVQGLDGCRCRKQS